MINITLREYVNSKDVSQYEFLEHSKPRNKYFNKELNVSLLTYGEVKAVMRTLRKMKSINDIKDIFETCFKIDENEFYSGLITEYFSAKNYVIQTFKELLEREIKLLKSFSGDSALWEAAGGNKLNKHSDVLPINQLGKIYSLYPFDLEHKKYQEILYLMVVEKDQNEVEKKFHELKSKMK